MEFHLSYNSLDQRTDFMICSVGELLMVTVYQRKQS